MEAADLFSDAYRCHVRALITLRESICAAAPLAPSSPVGFFEHLVASMALCRQHMETGEFRDLPGIRKLVIAAFTESLWPSKFVDEIETLARDHILAGYMNPNGDSSFVAVRCADSGSTQVRDVAMRPLEMSLRRGNIPMSGFLVEMGARTDVSAVVGDKVYSDLYEFAEKWWGEGTMVATMRSAAMRRRVSELLDSTATALPAAAATDSDEGATPKRAGTKCVEAKPTRLGVGESAPD